MFTVKEIEEVIEQEDLQECRDRKIYVDKICDEMIEELRTEFKKLLRSNKKYIILDASDLLTNSSYDEFKNKYCDDVLGRLEDELNKSDVSVRIIGSKSKKITTRAKMSTIVMLKTKGEETPEQIQKRLEKLSTYVKCQIGLSYITSIAYIILMVILASIAFISLLWFIAFNLGLLE